MNKIIRQWFLGLLCIALLSFYPSALRAQEARTAFDEVVKAGNFAPGQLEAHYLKHGDQFGAITQEQYLQQARDLLDAQPQGDVLEKVRHNGDIEHFRVSTGEFAVMTRKGRIRTYFKTDYGYWLRQNP